MTSLHLNVFACQATFIGEEDSSSTVFMIDTSSSSTTAPISDFFESLLMSATMAHLLPSLTHFFPERRLLRP